MNPAVLGALAALFWGLHDLVAGVASRRIGHMVVVLGVTLFGLAGLTVPVAMTGTFPDVLRAEAWIPVLAGIGYAAATMFLFAAFAAGPFSVAAPVGGSYPLTSMLIAALFGASTTGPQLATALVVIGGVIVVALAEPGGDANERWDRRAIRKTLIYAGLAHLSFAGAIALGQRAAVIFGTVEGTWIGRIAGAAAISILFLATSDRRALPGRWIFPVAAIGVLDATAICLLNAAGNTGQPQIAAVAGSTFGVVTILLARIVLKEAIPPLRWLGIAATFVGVAVLSALEGK